jgi:hypothetical protein
MQLFKSRYVLTAALRDPRAKNQPNVARADARHNAIEWLGEAIRVECPDPRTGILAVKLTSSDANEAAALVNAVVDAYMTEVVNCDRQARRERLSDLQATSAEKENEVRIKREELKRELENIGAGDEQTMAIRTQLAVGMYFDFQRQFQAMRAEQRVLSGKLQEAKRAVQELAAFEVPEVQVAALLNNNPAYRELQNRVVILESSRPKSDGTAPETKPADESAQAELKGAKAQLQTLEAATRDQIRSALRIEWQNEVRRLESQVDISAKQLSAFEKEVERKGNEAESVGRSSVSVHMARAEVDALEQVLRDVTLERETLRIELKAGPRVVVLGDRNSPAAIPECPD